MLIRDKLIKELAKEYKVSEPVVRSIVFSPLRFVRKVVTNKYDYRPIRIRHFGVFTMKKNYLKAINDIREMYKILMEHIDYTYMLMASVLGFQLVDVSSAKKVLRSALEDDDVDKIRMIFKEFIMHVTPTP